MKTIVLRVNPTEPEPEAIAEAAGVLRRGGLVAFPTETVYGLGALAHDATAVAKIFAAKGRPANNPLIVHVAGPPFAGPNKHFWPDIAQRLAAQFWPGPLTMVLPKPAEIPAIVTARGATWAVRMPDHAVAYALVRSSGAIAAPSANRSNAVSATTAEHVLESLDGKVELVLDSGACRGGIESTVIDLTRSPPRVLRHGPIRPSELRAVLGEVLAADLRLAEETASLPSPGTSIRHYAPKAIVECFGDATEAVSRADKLRASGQRVRIVGRGVQTPREDLVRMPAGSAEYAALLYQTLHQADRDGVAYLVFHLPPQEEEWLAIRDRLRRAATVWRD
jgi:L-threonylcarbamoyladenylate synthase